MSEQAKVSLFQRILKSVEPAGVAILSGYRDYPNALRSDVDVLGTRDVLSKLKSLVVSGECRAVQVIQHEATCFYWVFYQADELGHPAFLQFDYSLDYRWGGRLFYHAEELLPHTRRKSGLPILAASSEFGYYLVKKIGKGILTPQHEATLSDLFHQDPQGCERELGRFFPANEGRVILQAASRRDWSWVRLNLTRMRRAMLRKTAFEHPWDTAIYYLGEALRWARRIFQPTGLVVAFLGPDGSGKSTVAERVTRDLQPAFRHTRIIHLRPSLCPRTGSGPVTDPHGQPPRNVPASIAKIFYWWGETLLGWLADIQPARVHSTFVAFDRFYHDLVADPKRYRFSGPLALARLMGRLLPQPDIFLILDLPAEVARERKPEIPLEQALVLRERYQALGESLPNTHLVDASRPLEEVIQEVEQVILDYLEQRVKKRL